MLAFQLQDGVTKEDLWPLVPDILSIGMGDVTVVYPSNGVTSPDNNLKVVTSNKGRSQGTLCYHRNGLLTFDIQHECEEHELIPMSKPYTLDYVRTMERSIELRLGRFLLRSKSLHAPIRRSCHLPRTYAALADESLIETDYTQEICDVMSPYQRVTIMQSRQFGRVLLLDDDIMLGESDDIYTTTVLGLDRGNNYAGTSVLILGGGDGGILHVLNSLPKPPRHVLMSEIDEEVMKACRLHMRSVCGSVLDNYQGDHYTIEVRDCVEVLKESADRGDKYDYVINDLTEFSVEKDKYGFGYDFQTNNILMELSFKCLKEGGKYLARGNCLSAAPYIEKIEREITQLGYPFQRYDLHVPSFREMYCFFEAVKTPDNKKH